MTRKPIRSIEQFIAAAMAETDGTYNLPMSKHKGTRSWLEARKQEGLERVTFFYRNKPIRQVEAESLSSRTCNRKGWGSRSRQTQATRTRAMSRRLWPVQPSGSASG